MAYDYSRITERLFVGAQINNEADVVELKAAGVTHVVDAQAERDDRLQENFSAARIAVLWDPTADDGVHPKPTAWFKAAIDFGMAALAVPGNIVLCHCAQGINRGPSLGYAILRAQGLSRFAARALFLTGRPQSLIGYLNDAELALQALGWTKYSES